MIIAAGILTLYVLIVVANCRVLGRFRDCDERILKFMSNDLPGTLPYSYRKTGS